VVQRESLGPEGTTTIKVAKVRYCGRSAAPGEVTGLRWNMAATRYEKDKNRRLASWLVRRENRSNTFAPRPGYAFELPSVE